jgi:hypothetical protein
VAHARSRRFGGLAHLLRIIQMDTGYPPEVQEQAVRALANVARHNRRNQTDIGRRESGAVAALVVLLRDSKSAAIEAQCPRAFWCVLGVDCGCGLT